MNLYAIYAAWVSTLTPSEFALYVILPATLILGVAGSLLERRKP